MVNISGGSDPVANSGRPVLPFGLEDFASRGCIVGGAIGDALGWPVECLKLKKILSRFGANGIQDLLLSSSGKAGITDDTQMTLFTAEGFLRSEIRGIRKGICHPSLMVFFAYQPGLLHI